MTQDDLSAISDEQWRELLPEGVTPELEVGEFFDWRPHFSDDQKTVPFSLRLPHLADRLLNVTQQRFQFIFATKADIARDAIWTYCRYLYSRMKTPDKQIAALLRLADAQADANYSANLRRQAKQHADDLQDALLDALCDHNLEECRRQIVQFWEAIKDNPSDWVREKYLTATRDSATIKTTVEVLTRFGYDIPPDCVAFYS